jgi:hypothetical protein
MGGDGRVALDIRTVAIDSSIAQGNYKQQIECQKL